MFEIWILNLIEILDEWEGYDEVSVETLETIPDYISDKRMKFLNESIWYKL